MNDNGKRDYEADKSGGHQRNELPDVCRCLKSSFSQNSPNPVDIYLNLKDEKTIKNQESFSFRNSENEWKKTAKAQNSFETVLWERNFISR